MSPRDFSLMVRGYEKRKVDSYKQTRMLMFTMVKLHGDPKSSPSSPEQLWELPGDEENKMTDSDYREIFKRLTTNG